MIVVTGGAGFIGSAFVWKLNCEGVDDIIVVDELDDAEKWRNLVKRQYADYLHKDDFVNLIRADNLPFDVRALIHMGACSSTTERDAGYLMENNYRYTCQLASWAMSHSVRFIYASSAATYGDGSHGFSDADETTRVLEPINIYGYSKQFFDLWVLRHKAQHKIAGVKFFNVFGPQEYHKGDMVSVVYKAFHQIREQGRVRLFKSHRPDFGDGEQVRDFVYVKDCVDVLWWLLKNRDANGIFNVGTGRARTWKDLVAAVFAAMGRPPVIEYIEMPLAVREQYQYFTEAKMEKLQAGGSPVQFQTLEAAVHDYVPGYLLKADPYL